jgi:flavin reductase (DIM6/NTAB) family NADH-FMN oxidoreductase RutF
MDPAIKKKTLRLFTYGLYVVTTRTGDDTGAFTANWVVQASFEPPMLAVAMEQDAHSLGVVRAAGSFAVNVLESGQRELAGQFGRA